MREKHEVSLRDCAEQMKISAPYLSDLERGNRKWDSELITRFNLAISAIINK